MNITDLFPPSGHPRRVMTITSSGTFTVPAGVNKLLVSLVGGGGSGGAFYRLASGANGRALGGWCGGGFFRKPFDVTPLQEITATIGAGGAAIARSTQGGENGNDGGDTTFIETGAGGNGGLFSSVTSGALGGSTYLALTATSLYLGSTDLGYGFEPMPPIGFSGTTEQANVRSAYGYSNGLIGGENASGGAGSPFGVGGDAAYSTSASVTALAGTAGSGGGAAVCNSTSSGRTATSGAGGDGIIIVEWYGPEATFT